MIMSGEWIFDRIVYRTLLKTFSRNLTSLICPSVNQKEKIVKIVDYGTSLMIVISFSPLFLPFSPVLECNILALYLFPLLISFMLPPQIVYDDIIVQD